MTKFLALAALAGGILLAGCAQDRHFGTPELQPCPPNVQVHRAERFDPYPSSEIGPEMSGVRPRGFETPAAERLSAPSSMPLVP